MKINRNVPIILAVAAVAFFAGRLDLFSGAASVANAVQDEGAEYDAEMMAKMEAMMKAGTPGAHHELLNTFVGEWDGTVKIRQAPDAPMMELPATITREWILDGRYLQETVVSESEWGMFKGIGIMGYNNVDGQYEMVWMDSHSTAIIMDTAIVDRAAMKMRSRGSYRDPATGHVVHTHGVTDMSSPDRHTYKAWATAPDGSEYQHFAGVFERK